MNIAVLHYGMRCYFERGTCKVKGATDNRQTVVSSKISVLITTSGVYHCLAITLAHCVGDNSFVLLYSITPALIDFIDTRNYIVVVHNLTRSVPCSSYYYIFLKKAICRRM